MIERKCEITSPSVDLLRSLVNTMLVNKPRIREIGEDDLDAVGDLLTRGFVRRNRDHAGFVSAISLTLNLPFTACEQAYSLIEPSRMRA